MLDDMDYYFSNVFNTKKSIIVKTEGSEFFYINIVFSQALNLWCSKLYFIKVSSRKVLWASNF
jgi:hypothetical protein